MNIRTGQSMTTKSEFEGGMKFSSIFLADNLRSIQV